MNLFGIYNYISSSNLCELSSSWYFRYLKVYTLYMYTGLYSTDRNLLSIFYYIVLEKLKIDDNMEIPIVAGVMLFVVKTNE